jgi:hypothetical protein
MTAPYRWIDGASLTLFAAAGRAHHAASILSGEILLTLVPLLLAWFSLAEVFGTYRGGGLRAFAWNWAAAVPLAAAARQFLRGQPLTGVFWQFLAIAGAMSFVFLLAGRALVGTFAARRARARASAP